MKVTVKGSMLVKPMAETPSGPLWLSSIDLIFPSNYHTRFVNFYRSDCGAGFFDVAVVKAALSRALVDFYPYAGRLGEDENGRIEIKCNGEGVGFVEAECDGVVDDLDGFRPRAGVSFLPTIDYSQGISTFPLFLVQLTRFRCGGVSLGFANSHYVADGISVFNFLNAWAGIARGLTTPIPPSLDRRVLLSPRNPPRPLFHHIEHQPPPSLKTPLRGSDETTFSIFKLSRAQISALKQQCQGKYSSFQVVTGHVWRCVTMARGLPEDQETKLRFSVDGRRRLRPPLPHGYIGTAIFHTAALALCGHLQSNPLSFAVGKVKDAIDRMDDKYLRSALDHLELRRRDANGVAMSENNLKCPNFGITDWVRLPMYEADFGWGGPVYSGPGAPLSEGRSYLFIDPQNEGCVFLAITLHKHHMQPFHKLLFESCIISKI